MFVSVILKMVEKSKILDFRKVLRQNGRAFGMWCDTDYVFVSARFACALIKTEGFKL